MLDWRSQEPIGSALGQTIASGAGDRYRRNERGRTVLQCCQQDFEKDLSRLDHGKAPSVEQLIREGAAQSRDSYNHHIGEQAILEH
jgi:hypothetical protein